MNTVDVVVLSGNSPAFHSIVIFLAALIGAVLLYELTMFLYQRVITKYGTKDLGRGGNLEYISGYFLLSFVCRAYIFAVEIE